MTLRILSATLLLALAPIALAAGNADAGKSKSQPCQSCHGIDGAGNPALGDQRGQYPILAGQYPDYIVKALGDYKAGRRQNAIMAGFAATLSEQDMEDLAAYFSSQQGPLHDLSQNK